MTDVTQLSDAELMALIQGGQKVQPVNAQTGQPLNPAQSQTYAQLAAAGGIDPRAEAGSTRLPRAQVEAGVEPENGYFVDTEGKVRQAGGMFDNVGRAVNDGVRAIARGIPVAGAWADEANARLNSMAAPVVEPLMQGMERAGIPTPYDERFALAQIEDPEQRFAAALNMQRMLDEGFDNTHPSASAGLKGAGTVAGLAAGILGAGSSLVPITARLAPGAGTLAQMGAGAVEGGAALGLQGAGEGEGDWNDPSRIQRGSSGALLGAAGGAAAPLAMQGVGAAWRATGGKVIDRASRLRDPGATSEARIADAIREQMSPAGMPVASPVDADRAIAEVLAARSQRPPTAVPPSAEDDAYARIGRAMMRAGQTPEQVVGRVEELGPFGMVADTSDAMRGLTRDAANRPSGAEDTIRRALETRQRGVFDPDAADWSVRPSSLRILDSAAEGMGLQGRGAGQEMDNLLAARKAAADPAYAAVRNAPPVDIGELRDFAGTPDFRAAYNRAREISQREFVTAPDGSQQIVPLPENFSSNETVDWRTLDLMKQAMDDMVSEGKVQGIGANANRSVKSFRDAFRDTLDRLNPDYRTARDAFAGPTAMMEALEEGRALLREDSYAIGRSLADMSASEQEMARLGALQALRDKVGNADVTYDAARQAGLLKPNQLERFNQLFPSRDAFASFVRTMEREQAMFQTRAAALGNSTTAKQLMAAQENDNTGVAQALTAGIAAKTGNLPAFVTILKDLGGDRRMPAPTAEALGSILTSMNPGALPAVQRRLTSAQAAEQIAKRIREMSINAGASAAAGTTRPRD